MRLIVLSVITLLWGCASPHGTSSTGPSSSSYPSTTRAPVERTVGVEIVFSDDEIRIIRAYYETHGSVHGNGKRKHKDLPPGIARNLARGKRLPPGIAKQALPYNLRRELPPPRDGYERIVVAGKVLLVELATQVVRDVLTDVVFS